MSDTPARDKTGSICAIHLVHTRSVLDPGPCPTLYVERKVRRPDHPLCASPRRCAPDRTANEDRRRARVRERQPGTTPGDPRHARVIHYVLYRARPRASCSFGLGLPVRPIGNDSGKTYPYRRRHPHQDLDRIGRSKNIWGKPALTRVTPWQGDAPHPGRPCLGRDPRREKRVD